MTTLTPDNVAIGKKLLNKLQSHTITMEDFEKEIAYFAIMCGFDELKPKEEPIRPHELEDYDALPKEAKAKVGSDFWRQPIIHFYHEERQRIMAWNSGTVDWLRELEARFTRYGDAVNANKCRLAWQEFKYSVMYPLQQEYFK